MKALVIGGSSFIGSALIAELSDEWEVFGTCFHTDDQRLIQLDITESSGVRETVYAINPDAILHLAALVNPDACEQNQLLARAINIDGAKNVAEVAAQVRAKIVFFSTDYVFDGTNPPYQEHGSVNPLNCYGRTKVEAEKIIQALTEDHLIVRLPIVYGRDRRVTGSLKPTFIMEAISELRQGKQFALDDRQIRYPILVDDIVLAISRLVTRDLRGTVHLGGPEGITKYKWGILIAQIFDLPETSIIPKIARSLTKRPHDARMLSTRTEIQDLKFRGVFEGLQEVKKQCSRYL